MRFEFLIVSPFSQCELEHITLQRPRTNAFEVILCIDRSDFIFGCKITSYSKWIAIHIITILFVIEAIIYEFI